MRKEVMNVLVTGANGQLGLEIRALSGGTKDHYIFTCLHESPGVETVPLDITNKDAVDIICESEKVDVIINCSAYNDVNRAEDDFQMADMINRQGVENLAAAAKKAKAVLIHISTDYVFDGGANEPYRETDAAKPLNSYGATKLSGERAVVSSGCKYFIFRTSWMYSKNRRNFLKTMEQLLSSRDSVSVVCDQTGTPTYAADLALFIVGIISSRKIKGNYGLYHFSDEGSASWYDFACAIKSVASLPGKVVPCRSKDFPQKASRPHYSVLDKSLVKKTFGVEIPHWLDSLKAFYSDSKI